MASKKALTKKQLEKLQTDALGWIKRSVKYAEDVSDYVKGLENQTVPPGTPPPKPPGTK